MMHASDRLQDKLFDIVSPYLLDVENLLSDTEFEKEFVTGRAKLHGSYPEETMRIMGSAHAVIIAFPLFGCSLPGALTRLLEDYYGCWGNDGCRRESAKVYAIVNCAFAAPEINAEAIRVLRNCCRRAGLDWRFALSIGFGLLASMTKGIPLLNMKIRRGFAEIAKDIRDGQGEERETILVKPFISKAILIAIRDRMEKKARLRFEKQLKLKGAAQSLRQRTGAVN